MESASRYYNMIQPQSGLEDVQAAPCQPLGEGNVSALDLEDQAFLDRILQEGRYCPPEPPQTAAPAEPEQPPYLTLQLPVDVPQFPPADPGQTGRPLIDPSDLLPTLDVTGQEATRTVTLHFETASVHTSHLFELSATGSLLKLITAIATKAGVAYPNPPVDQLQQAKSQPMVIAFKECSFHFVHFLKQHYKLRSEKEIESILGFPNFIQGNEKKTYRIMIEKWSKSPDQHLLMHDRIPRRIEEFARRGVEQKGRLLFTGMCPSIMRAAALSTADYLARLDGPIFIVCHPLVVPFWDLLINSFKRHETNLELVSLLNDSIRTCHKISPATELGHGIYICSARNFVNFTLPQSKNLTVILDDALSAIVQSSPEAIKQFRSVHRCLVIFPDFSNLKKTDKYGILSELVHPDIHTSSSYFELIEKLHVVDTDEDMFSEADKFRIEVGVYTSDLDSQRIEEMAEISQILEQRDKAAIKQRYEEIFGGQKLASLEKNLRSQFEQATDRPSCRKQPHPEDALATPSNVDIEFKLDTQAPPDTPAELPDLSPIEAAGDPANAPFIDELESSPHREEELPADRLPADDENKNTKNLTVHVIGNETPILDESPDQVKHSSTLQKPDTKLVGQDPDRADSEPPQLGIPTECFPVSNDLTAAKESKQSQKKTFQVGDLEEYISNHIFECAKGALQFRMLSLNSETKISSILEILEQRIVVNNKKKVIIWVHHQHISEKIHAGCLDLLDKLEFGHSLKFNLHSIFSKQSRARMSLITKLREDTSPYIAIIPILSQKEVLLGIKFDLMIFSELIHQSDALFAGADLAKLCGDQTDKELLFFRSNLSFDFGLWTKYQKLLKEEYGCKPNPEPITEPCIQREEKVDLRSNRGYQQIAVKEYPVYQAEIDSFFRGTMIDSYFKNRIRRESKKDSAEPKKREQEKRPGPGNPFGSKLKRTSKEAIEYKNQIINSNAIQIVKEPVASVPKNRYRSKTVHRLARRFEDSLKSNPDTFQISFPNSLDNSLWNIDFFASGDSRSLISVEQTDYATGENQVALYDKRSVKSVLVSTNSLRMNEQLPPEDFRIRL